jgi:tRNA G18 (ribose-2'-O)-methylase SpoU
VLRIERVEELSDPRVADYRNVRDPELCRDAGLFMAEGRLNVQRLLERGRYRVRSLFLTETGLEAMHSVLRAHARELPIYVADSAVLNGVVGYNMHRGCLAAGERGPTPLARESFERAGAGPRLWVALEALANADNVGGIFRTAHAFGAEGVLLASGCVDPLYRKSIRVSMGAALELPFEVADDLPGALSRMAKAGFRTLGLCVGPGASPLEAWRIAGPDEAVVLVVGNEGRGLSDAALSACSEHVAISMATGVDSLNANMAAGIALHHVVTQLGGPAALSR